MPARNGDGTTSCKNKGDYFFNKKSKVTSIFSKLFVITFLWKDKATFFVA